MATSKLHILAEKASDWKILVGIAVVVLTTAFNFVSGLFNMAIVTKLEPITKEVSAIKGDVSDTKGDVSQIKNVTDNLPSTYVSTTTYREDMKELKYSIGRLLQIHLK